MDWFTDIPKIVLVIVAVIGFMGIMIFVNSVDYRNPDKFNENLEKTTGFIVDTVVPTEINWISSATNKVSNPWILLILIIGILWLSGHFLSKRN